MNPLRRLFRRWVITYKYDNRELWDLGLEWRAYKKLKKEFGHLLTDGDRQIQGSGESCNKIWWCWLQGEEKAPDLCKVCLESLRRHIPDREIVVVTHDNLQELTDLPDYIIKKWKDGRISNVHFSDILRLALLCKHGGTWIDSTVLCTNYPEEIFNEPLFMYQGWMRNNKAVALSSWLITAEKQNPILLSTRKMLWKYWESHNSLEHYLLFHLFVTIAAEHHKELWGQMPRFSNIPPHILQFELEKPFTEKRFNQIKKMSSIHKLTRHKNFNENKGDFADFILHEYLDRPE